MGEIVDLGAFRKLKEEEEAEEARKQKEKAEQQEQEEYEYLSDLVHRIMTNLDSLVSGASPQYYSQNGYHPDYSAEDVEITTYFHEAGYDDDGEYYERSWEFEPWGGPWGEPEKEDDDSET
jgi:hypothetical protein